MGGFVETLAGGLGKAGVGSGDIFGGLSKVSGFDVGGVVPGLTGQTGAEAALAGSQLQYDATLKGIEAQQASEAQQRADLAPFRNLVTPSILDLYKNYATNLPDYSYNPETDSLLNNAVNRASRQTLNLRAAQGKAGSGGTEIAMAEALAPLYMQRQGQLFEQNFNARNQGYNQLNQYIANAQNAAAGQGAATAATANNVTDLLGQGGNALAAGGIGAANAYSQGASNVAGIGGMLAGLFAASDERLKENVLFLGKDEEGNNLYEFEYKDQEKPRYVGHMAQEILKKDPDHVRMSKDGFLMVSPKYAPKRVA